LLTGAPHLLFELRLEWKLVFFHGLTNERDFPVPNQPRICGRRQLSATMGSANSHQLVRKGKSMAIVTLGIDLAKNVFALHGVDEAGKPVLVRPSVARGKLLELVASLPPCLIGMEACSGAHHWARLF